MTPADKAQIIGDLHKPNPFESLPHYQVRLRLVERVALKHNNEIIGLARELGVSKSLVSLYIRGRRPMSASFVVLVANTIPDLVQPCQRCLVSFGHEKWLGVKPQMAVLE